MIAMLKRLLHRGRGREQEQTDGIIHRQPSLPVDTERQEIAKRVRDAEFRLKLLEAEVSVVQRDYGGAGDKRRSK